MKCFRWMFSTGVALAFLLSGPVLRLRAAARTTEAGVTNLDFTNHVTQLKKMLPKGFVLVLQPPFIVVGDETPQRVQERATGTVKWAVARLKRDFFTRDPNEIIDIWLFKDKASYEKHTKAIFGDVPTTPFGYYSPQHKSLIMNIATGGGTLVHEIVHPFMRANFPECPAWFNEGMGSLFEQSGDENGHIRGYTNWRLPALQAAIKAGNLPSFEKLLSTTDDEFYGRGSTSNYSQHYAQARYLCYYLQENNLLVNFYREFTANATSDPTGRKSLQKVLGTTDLKAFQKTWEAYVLKLTFP